MFGNTLYKTALSKAIKMDIMELSDQLIYEDVAWERYSNCQSSTLDCIIESLNDLFRSLGFVDDEYLRTRYVILSILRKECL